MQEQGLKMHIFRGSYDQDIKYLIRFTIIKNGSMLVHYPLRNVLNDVKTRTLSSCVH